MEIYNIDLESLNEISLFLDTDLSTDLEYLNNDILNTLFNTYFEVSFNPFALIRLFNYNIPITKLLNYEYSKRIIKYKELNEDI